MFKLNHKSLKCIFLGYSWVQKGYRCYCPSLRRYLISVDITFLENVPFSLPPTHTSQGEEDDLLVYAIASPIVSPEPARVSSHVKSPITQVYLRCQNPPALSPSLPGSSSDPIKNDDLTIALRVPI